MSRDRVEASDGGERVRYDGETGSFVGTESPVVPYLHGDGVGEVVVSAARRVLDAAADEMGRQIHWLRLYAGTEAEDRYGDPLPEATTDALERFRVGLVGPLSERPDHRIETALHRRLDLRADVRPISHLERTPSAVTTREDVDVVCFRDITEDAAAALEFPDGSGTAGRMRTFLETELDGPGIEPGPAGFGIRPITRAGTERIVERAAEYALDHNRDRVTVVHRGDRLPATEGGFREWALAFLEAEYGDATITEEAFRDGGGDYPEDELVVGERETTEVCRDLISRPGELDVLVAPAYAGEHVATVASEAVGGAGVTPSATLGDGYFLASPLHGSAPSRVGRDRANPIATIRAGCLLVEALGWDDVAGVVRDAIEATLADRIMTPDLARRTARSEGATTAEFADRVVEHVRAPGDRAETGGVRSTPEERAAIKSKLVGLYDILFEDRLRAADVELNQLRGEDEEAEIYLPEVGINFRYWRRWSVERRLEVLLHEFAHVENYDDDHEPPFYDRLVELTGIAEDWRTELEVVFDEPIDFELVKRYVVESVHEETIEPDVESVEDRKRALREAFRLPPDGHY